MKRITIALLSWVALSAQATTLAYKDMNALVKEAEGIVVGTVKEVVSSRAEDKQLYTYVHLTDVEVPTGNYHDTEFTLVLEGGFDGREGIDIEGSPEFKPEERVVLFVEGNGRHMVPLVGWGQGVFKLVRDQAGNGIVTDDLGNEVYGIDRSGRILKANRLTPRAEIKGAPPFARNFGSQPGFSPGQADNGTETKVINGPSKATPLPADHFLKMIEQRAQARAFSQELRSAQKGQSIRRAPLDAVLPGEKAGAPEALKESVPPRRLESVTTPDTHRH